MSTFFNTLHDVATMLGGGSVLYAASIASATATSLFARTPGRRHDAHVTLKLLIRHRFTPNSSEANQSSTGAKPAVPVISSTEDSSA